MGDVTSPPRLLVLKPDHVPELHAMNTHSFPLSGLRSLLCCALFCAAVVALAAPEPFRLSVVQTRGVLLGIDGLRLRVEGTPGDAFIVDSSSNLTHWTPVAGGVIPPGGVMEISDGTALQAGRRFYRIRPDGRLPIRSDRLLIKPVAGADLTLLHRMLGGRVLRAFPAIGGLQVLELPAGRTAWEALAAYRRSALVAYAEPDFLVRALAEPNDFRFFDGSLWGLHNTGQLGGTPDADIDAPEAWDVRTSAAGIVVALTDTGIRATHEDLAANLWSNPGEIAGNGVDDDGNGYVDDVHGVNILDGTGNPVDDHGHGTHIGGVVGGVGNNSVGVVGVAWRVQLMAVKFLDAQGNGSISDAVAAIDYARARGARIINASWGSPEFNSQSLSDAIASARDAGILFVAAAGNSSGNNDATPLYPASYDLDNILAVAATDRNDQLAFFADFGASTVDIGAPGQDIFSCWNDGDGGYRFFSGSSMAAGYASGAAALVMAQHPGEGFAAIKQRLLSGADPVPSLQGRTVSGGRLNLFKALSSGSPPPPPPPERPVVTITATDPNAGEAGPDTGTFTITRTGTTTASLIVRYSIGGTAANGADYETIPDATTIPAGADSATITVTPMDDAEVEGDESVVLTLAGDTTYDIGSPGSATVTITDNDAAPPPPERPVITVVAIDADASETGPDAGVVRFRRTGDASQPLTVNWTFSGTAENGADFQRLPTSGAFPAGMAEADLTIMPVDDDAVEDNETVVVTVTSGAAYDIGTPSSATVTIADNDAAPPPPPQRPVVTVVASDPNASERGPDPGSFTVSRTGDTGTALTVNFTVGGTATSGTDYEALGTAVTIPAGARSAQLPVKPIDDAVVEDDETVVLTLAAGTGYDAGSPGSATVTLTDDDTPPPPPPQRPTVTVVASDALAAESGPDRGEFTFSRTGDTTTTLTVRYTVGGTAKDGVDYAGLFGLVTIPAGARSNRVVVMPINDSVPELPETVIVNLAASPAYHIGIPATAIVTILDDDLVPLP
jgi:large repetitive protein